MTTIQRPGPRIIAGYQWGPVTITVTKAGGAFFPTGIRLKAQFRAGHGSPVLAELTTENGGLSVPDSTHLIVTLPSSPAQATWPSKVMFDVVRTDITPNLHMGLSFIVPVGQPITSAP